MSPTFKIMIGGEKILASRSGAAEGGVKGGIPPPPGGFGRPLLPPQYVPAF